MIVSLIASVEKKHGSPRKPVMKMIQMKEDGPGRKAVPAVFGKRIRAGFRPALIQTPTD